MGMAEEQNANKKLVVCRSCHAEAERNNAYCSMCGSHELVRKDKFLKELENKAQAEKVLEKEFKRMSLAFAELQALERGMHCSSCIAIIPKTPVSAQAVERHWSPFRKNISKPYCLQSIHG